MSPRDHDRDTPEPGVEAVWVDGELVPGGDAAVSAVDHGVTVGDGVFETIKVMAGRPFAMSRHLARLRRSAAGLHLPIERTDEELAGAVREVLEAAPGAGRLRITVTGGPGPLGSRRGPSPATVIVAASPAGAWEPTSRVVTVPWRRNEHGALVGLKTTSYAENVIALERAHEQGADEAIFANTAGNLCEGTGTNVFVGVGGRLVTPPLSSGCLAGITRELVFELVEVAEEDLPLDALAAADEAFLTSSTRDVQPISHVDGKELPGCPGPLTRAAMGAFAELQGRDLDP